MVMVCRQERAHVIAIELNASKNGGQTMSWEHPTPPIYPFWKGMLILTGTVLVTGGLLYLLVA